MAETANHAIQKITAAGVVSTLAGSAGASGDDARGYIQTSTGAWTLQVSSANGAAGLALVEVYDLP